MDPLSVANESSITRSADRTTYVCDINSRAALTDDPASLRGLGLHLLDRVLGDHERGADVDGHDPVEGRQRKGVDRDGRCSTACVLGAGGTIMGELD